MADKLTGAGAAAAVAVTGLLPAVPRKARKWADVRDGKTPAYRKYVAPGFTWLVLKGYQKDDSKPSARWFVAAQGPGTFGGWDLGDSYVKDIVTYGTLVEVDGKAVQG